MLRKKRVTRSIPLAFFLYEMKAGHVGKAVLSFSAKSALLLFTLCILVTTSYGTNTSCDLQGFNYKAGWRPYGYSVTFLSASRQPNVTAAASACSMDPSCLMFTTDGWLLGMKAYTTKHFGTLDFQDMANHSDLLQYSHLRNTDLHWDKPYCGECNDAPGCCGSSNDGAACCGTYVVALQPGQRLELQRQEAVPPDLFTFDGIRLPDWSVIAVNAPCVGHEQVPLLHLGNCTDHPYGICPRPRCTTTMLGAQLDDFAQTAMWIDNLEQAIKVDNRCASMTWQQVQSTGHPGCCETCWTTCCKAMTGHINRWSQYCPHPLVGDKDFPTPGWGLPKQLNQDPSLNYPDDRECSDADVARRGSCCEQLHYMHSYMPLDPHYWSSCSRECAERCGFVVDPAGARSVTEELWCVVPFSCFGHPGVLEQPLHRHTIVKAEPATHVS